MWQVGLIEHEQEANLQCDEISGTPRPRQQFFLDRNIFWWNIDNSTQQILLHRQNASKEVD
jgi:hypothetical protein